jgi:hypothetical protein
MLIIVSLECSRACVAEMGTFWRVSPHLHEFTDDYRLLRIVLLVTSARC